MLSRFCRNAIKSPQTATKLAKSNVYNFKTTGTSIKQPFCVYRNLQEDISRNINLNNQRVEQMRMEFSELRELQKKFFWRLSEESAVNLFKVSFSLFYCVFFAFSSNFQNFHSEKLTEILEIESTGYAQGANGTCEIHQAFEVRHQP